jgi:hypothetical protein
MTELFIRGGTVIDETGERRADVRVVDGRVIEVGSGLTAVAGATVLDAEGCVVAPGLVDIQVHFREPGREDAETIETGARGAALGGFTAVVAMPNTTPPFDDPAVVRSVLEAGRRAACEVNVAGCITLGRAGVELAPMGELYELGVRVFTDDGDCVPTAAVMRRALEYARALPGAVISQHAEDPSLVAGGHMHEGEWSSRLGIPGRPAEAESIIVARDLELVRLTGGRYHVLHMSTARATELIRQAKAEGLRVTAEASPQHFSLTDAACASFDPVFKMNPPLRRRRRRDHRGSGRRHHRCHRDRPRAPRAGGEGAAVRGGPAGHARRRDRARGDAHQAGRARPADDARGAGAALVAPGPHRRARRPPRPAGRAGRGGQSVCHRPGRAMGTRRRAYGQPVAQHAVRGHEAHRPHTAHPPARGAGRRPGRGPAVTAKNATTAKNAKTAAIMNGAE